MESNVITMIIIWLNLYLNGISFQYHNRIDKIFEIMAMFSPINNNDDDVTTNDKNE